MKRVLIETLDGHGEIALMEDKRLLHFSREMPDAVEAEQIYLGRVDRIVKGMEAAFVKLGRDQVGFLPFSECVSPPRSGDMLPVQVKKPPLGGKAPYLTADVSLAGRYTILTPLSQKISVSKRIQDEETRRRLAETAARLAPTGMGLVMRAESSGMEDSVLRGEIRELCQAWDRVLDRKKSAAGPGLLRNREDALARLLRDEQGTVDEILTDDPAALPAFSIPVKSCPHPFDLYNVRDKLKKSLQRKVWLDCGGYLVIDRTEALTVIDVNSGKYTGKKTGAESTFLALNREAAREIARLCRLRNLGGIIIIDFVDMQSDESRAAVTQALLDALRDDPVKTTLHGFTALGLMEMTRKKTDAPDSLLPPEDAANSEE